MHTPQLRRVGASAFLALTLSAAAVLPAAANNIPPGSDPAPNPVSARIESEFLMGMVPHHQGAIEISQMALQKSPNAEVRKLAQQVIAAQTEERATMTHWLRDWYGQSPAPGNMMPMQEMREMADDLKGMMPDMQARMERLNSLAGAAFDVEYLSQLFDHHAMAVGMAMPVLVNGHHADLYDLAERIVIAQGEEMRMIDDMLQRLYGVQRPLESATMTMPAMPAGGQ